jgi:hypothetical protein
LSTQSGQIPKPILLILFIIAMILVVVVQMDATTLKWEFGVNPKLSP